MELFRTESKINFMGARFWTACFSVIVLVVSISSLMTKGLNWGLDFTGGTQVEVSYQQAADMEDIRNRLAEGGFEEAEVQGYDTPKDVLIRISPREDLKQSELVAKVMSLLPGATKQRSEFVGPQVGAEMATKGALAILVALLATMIYVAVRFEYRFAVSAAVALIHDPLFILGVFAIFQYEFDLKALAAILAVIGYSLNDTIVVFDRVRENFHKMRKASTEEVMNVSINQTLSRTIITSVLTLVVVLALFVYGGEAVRGFSLALMIGIVVGTYSSVYVASTLALALGLSKVDLMPVQRQELDSRP